MKNIWIIGLLWSMAIGYTACSDDEDTMIDFSCPEITTFDAVKGNGEVILNWEIDKADNLSHFKVAYHATDDTLITSLSVDGKLNTLKIEGLLQKEYDFSIIAVNIQGKISGVKTLKVIPDVPRQYQVIETVHIEQLGDSAKISWQSQLTEGLKLNVVMEKNGSIQRRTYVMSDYPGQVLSIPLSDGYTDFKVSCIDMYGNASATKVKTCMLINIAHDKWSIKSYSTQQSGKEARLMIDGSHASYNGWESINNNNGKVLPQWVIVDLGEVVHIARLTLWKRVDKNDRCREAKVYTSMDGDEFEEQVTFIYPDNNTSDDKGDPAKHCREQAFTNLKARYVKCAVVRTGSSGFCSLGELYIYGFPEE